MDSLDNDAKRKIVQGYTSANELEKVDNGFNDRSRPTYVSTKLELMSLSVE